MLTCSISAGNHFISKIMQKGIQKSKGENTRVAGIEAYL